MAVGATYRTLERHRVRGGMSAITRASFTRPCTGVLMRNFHRIFAAAFLLISVSAFADSTNFTQLGFDISISPNNGAGDNLGGEIFGTGVSFSVGGGTPSGWFNPFTGYAPGSGGGGGYNHLLRFRFRTARRNKLRRDRSRP